MKKFPIVIIVLVVISLLIAADYYLNNFDKRILLEKPSEGEVLSETATTEEAPTFTDAIFKLNEVIEGYKVVNQVRTNQIFEKIDLSSINNIKIYKSRLEKADTSEPLFIYEIHGPQGQGSITYLNVKLQFVAQINATTETLNEDAEFGHNSFFFNDLNYKNTSFLLTQITDNLFGFQFNREDKQAYEDISTIIQKLL